MLTDREIILGLKTIFDFAYYHYDDTYSPRGKCSDIFRNEFSKDSIIKEIRFFSNGFVIELDKTYRSFVLYESGYYDDEIISLDYEGDTVANYEAIIKDSTILDDAKNMDDIQFKLMYSGQIKFDIIRECTIFNLILEKITAYGDL